MEAITRNSEGQGGFTLIELMVVIAIIAILAAIAIPQYYQYLETAKAQTVAADLKIAVDGITNGFAASNNGAQINLKTSLSGGDVADPVYGSGTPAFVVGSGGSYCGQIGIVGTPNVSVITASSPQEITLSVVTTGCTGNLGTAIARAISAAGFPSAATASGVVITQNGRVTP